MFMLFAGFRGQNHLMSVLLGKENEMQCAKVSPNCAVPYPCLNDKTYAKLQQITLTNLLLGTAY